MRGGAQASPVLGRRRGWLPAVAAVALIGGGWVTPPRSLDVMHAEMARAGQARLFDGALNDRAPDLPAVEEELARRIRALLRPDGGQVP